MAKILILEDNIELAQMVRDSLRQQMHVVEMVHRAEEASDFLKAYPFDLVVLDLQLPDGSGIEVCRQFRLSNTTTPVLMLTGLDTIPEKIIGLDSGADDYLTKPFQTEELLARVRSLLRRQSDSSDKLSLGNLTIDMNAHSATVQSQSVLLSPREFELLLFFLNHVDQSFDAEALRTRVWGALSDVSRKAVMTTISRLRTKLTEKGCTVSIKTENNQYSMPSEV